MSSFEMTIRKGDKINLENQAFQTEWGGVYLCVGRYTITKPKIEHSFL